jgi:hypothetical protein
MVEQFASAEPRAITTALMVEDLIEVHVPLGATNKRLSRVPGPVGPALAGRGVLVRPPLIPAQTVCEPVGPGKDPTSGMSGVDSRENMRP